jgi:tetratricopeptide (TPR) repeat protein
MNDTSTLLQDKEELVKEIDRFPIHFGSGSPGSVFDKVTIEHGERKARITTSLKEELKDAALISSVAPDLGKSIERQIQRLLSDLRRSPKNVYLLNNLGNTYLSIGAVDRAIECFERALDINKDFRLAMVSLAKSYMIQDEPGEALKIYLEYARKYPSDAKVLVDLAHVYLRLEKLDEARVTIEKSISLKPDNPNAHHTSGIIYLIQGDVDKSIAAFRRATSLDAHFAPAYTALGVCYAIKGSHTKSIKYLKIAYAIDPQGMYAAKNLAKAYHDRGDFEAAATLMTEYLKRYPRDWEAQNKLAYSYCKLGEYTRSLQCLQSLLSSHFETPVARERYAAVLNNMGVVHLRMGSISYAENMFRKSLMASDRPDPVTYFNLTRMLTDLGRREEAKKLIEEYITIAPDDNTPLILLALNYMNDGAYEKSRDILDGILSKDPDSRSAHVLLSLLNSEVFDNFDSAIEILKQEIAKNKSDQTIQNDLAYSYLRKGLIDEASDILGSVNWDKATFPLYATKGLLQIAKGNLKEGIHLYNTAVSKAPSNELKNLVRQKRGIEVARYFFMRGERDEALRQLHSALSTKTKTKLYVDQASRLLQQIENLPEQSRFPFQETGTKGDQQGN